MIKPVGSDELNPLFDYDAAEREALAAEAENMPSVVISSQAAGNAVMMGAGYFNPLKGFMNVADAMGAAESMTLTDGSFFPVPVLCLLESADGFGVGDRIALRDPNLDGNPVLAAAAYNAGPGNASIWWDLLGGDPDLFLEIVRYEETRNYIRGIYEIFAIYRLLYDRTP